MKHGLPRKLRRAFILQAVAVTFAILTGTVVVSAVSDELRLTARLHAEAERFWQEHARNPAAQAPHSVGVHAVFAPLGAPSPPLPPDFVRQGPGMHELRHQGARLLIEERDGGRLYLSIHRASIDGPGGWTMLVWAALALVTMYVAAWFTYRVASRYVGPVNQLANDVAQWDPRDSTTDAFSLHRTSSEGTEVRQLAAALDDLALRMRDHVQREREFTRDTSHELRTPLTVIRVATDMMLSDPETSDRARRALMRMQRAGRDMETVIESFLILARAGDVEPQAEAFDVHDAISDELDKARVALAGRPVELVVTVNASPRLHASPKVLALMFGNLLENACTFTESGRIDVIVEADRLVVRDTGIGMAADVLRKVYDPFFRADPFRLSGKGMGLSVVQRLGERFGWPVTLDSTPNVGTTATIGFARAHARVAADEAPG